MSGPAPARLPRRLGATPVVALWTGSLDGDQRPVVERGLASVLVPQGRVVVGVRQVHGRGVAVVRDEPDAVLAVADAVVSDRADVCAAVLVADCAPIALATSSGVFAAVHAGWRGLVAGVVDAAVDTVRATAGTADVTGVLGPCIGACCYAFSPHDLDAVAARLGDDVRATTRVGVPALSLEAAVMACLERLGVGLEWRSGCCTSCDPGWFSARGHADVARQALFVWRQDAAA